MRVVGPNIDAVALKNGDLADVLRNLHKRILDLESRTGLQGTDSTKQSVTMPPPPAARVGVTTIKGVFKISITNPQFQPINVKNPTNPNPFGTPIYHVLESSPTPDFRANVESHPASPQTYFEVSASGTRYYRVRSTYDGQNFTTSQVVGPFKA
jgi:hypothetical protein